jgi:hypothetical protein
VRAVAALLLGLGCGLLFGLPSHVPFEPALGRAADRQLALFGPKMPPHLSKLLFHHWAREIAAECAVRDVIVAGQLLQRFACRPTPKQFLVGNEPAQATATIHP